MDLVERYLAAIRRNLPAAKAGDIAAELRDELLSQREDREEALGRALTRDETSALLRDFGHPLAIAARYRPHQYLIGPEVFPFYLFVLRIVLAAGVALFVGLGVIGLVLGDGQLARTAARTVGDLWGFFFYALAVVTIVFAVLERSGFPAGHLAKWTPEQLPEPLDRPQSQWESAIEVGLGIAFILWWTGVVAAPALFHQGGVRIVAGPVWQQLYLPILLLACVQLGINILKWVRPRWNAVTRVLTIGTCVATLAIVAVLYRADAWVSVSAAGADPGQTARIGESVNLSLRIALIVVAVVMVLQVLGELWKLLRPRPGGV